MCRLLRFSGDGMKKTIVFLLIGVFGVYTNAACLPATQIDLTELSIEELMGIKVTSVSKKSQALSESAAAIFVITNDDLKRSGVTNVPDALRMVPGMNVARIDSNKWAISARGFNSRFSAHLLVLIDGRSVYTPVFSGVYWETNDVMLEDVDRIEVIRGPGATLWGANAVNGVINIITKPAEETQGGLISVVGGDFEETMATVRYGGSLGENTHWRMYAKHQERDEFEFVTGEDANDDWTMTQAGFKIDSQTTAKDKITLQGDIYKGEINQDLFLVRPTPLFTGTEFEYMGIFPVKTSVSGGNMLSRWHHTLSSTSDFSLQLYYDTTTRTEGFVDQERDNIDIEFQHHFATGDRHDIIWGIRYRYIYNDYTDLWITDIDPSNRHDDLYSAFIQDEISLWDDQVHLTLGSKFEHNDYTGIEVQPSARLMWSVTSKHKLWGAVSKAVRTPSHAEADAVISSFAFAPPPDAPPLPPGVPVVFNIVGNDDYDSEELIAYELGYRFIPAKRVSLDMTLFYNQYDKLRGFENQTPYFTGTTLNQDALVVNKTKGNAYGAEVSMVVKVSDFFKCDLAYSFFDTDITEQIGGFFKHQVSARGQFSLTDTLNLDVWFRYADDTAVNNVLSGYGLYKIDDYVTMDVRLGWDITPEIELTLVGQNLLEESHLETVQEAFGMPTEVKRSFYGKLTYRF